MCGAVTEHPYQKIAARNPFRLHPIPPPPAIVVPPEPLLKDDVRLTGLTDVAGRKLALLEVTEPGQTLKRAILAEGELSGVVEVVRIDLGGSRVQLRVRGVEANLAFPPGRSADGPPIPRLTPLLPRRS